MKKFATVAALAAALSIGSVSPAAAQDAQVTIYYGDLDIATPAGSQKLGERFEAGLKAACIRPDIRDLKAMMAWEQCKDDAAAAAAEQLARQGVSADVARAIGAN